MNYNNSDANILHRYYYFGPTDGTLLLNKLMAQIKDDNYPPADIFIQGVKAFYFNDKIAQNKLLSYLGGENKDLTILAAQLFLLQEKLDPEIHKQFLDITYASKDEEIHQCGELLEYKTDDKPLLYEHFW